VRKVTGGRVRDAIGRTGAMGGGGAVKQGRNGRRMRNDSYRWRFADCDFSQRTKPSTQHHPRAKREGLKQNEVT
jgi:hypothetical protein